VTSIYSCTLAWYHRLKMKILQLPCSPHCLLATVSKLALNCNSWLPGHARMLMALAIQKTSFRTVPLLLYLDVSVLAFSAVVSQYCASFLSPYHSVSQYYASFLSPYHSVSQYCASFLSPYHSVSQYYASFISHILIFHQVSLSSSD
jgi:hypothetical protein